MQIVLCKNVQTGCEADLRCCKELQGSRSVFGDESANQRSMALDSYFTHQRETQRAPSVFVLAELVNVSTVIHIHGMTWASGEGETTGCLGNNYTHACNEHIHILST